MLLKGKGKWGGYITVFALAALLWISGERDVPEASADNGIVSETGAASSPAATPYLPYDEVVPDDSDLQIDDEVGPDNPSWDEINESMTETEEEEETDADSDDENDISVFVPEKGVHISNSKAEYVVTTSDDTFGTVEYYRPKKSRASVSIPSTVTISGISYDVTSLAEDAFKKDKKLTSVTIGDNIAKIGNRAFYGCTNLKTVNMGTGVTGIGAGAFYNCTKLRKLTVPSDVSKIGKQAFAGLKGLRTMVLRTKNLTSAKLGKKAFTGISQNAVVRVPKAKLAAYKKLFRKKGLNKKIKIKGY